MTTSSNRILGIDFGTTNSACAIMDGADPKIIVNNEGERTTPSVVAFDDGEQLVGKPAKNQAVKNPEETIASIKRHMGESHYTVTLDDAEYTPEQISGMILEKIKYDAEAYVSDDIEKVVITVPAYFNDRQRQAIKDAGETAGFEVERIINEPSAASMAYGLGDESDQTVLVCDLGGGSFSVAVLNLGGGVYEVVATNGNNSLGGDDWDHAITDHLADDFEDEHGIDLRKDEQALARLKDAAEKAKVELSSRTKTTITLPYIATDEDGRKDLETSLTRAKFESLTADLLERVKDPTKQALADADYSTSDIDEVILVGGATRMPMVRDKIEELTGKERKKNVNPDEAVALGAAIQGGVLSGEKDDIVPGEKDDIVLLDVTPLSLGVKLKGGSFERLIKKNTTIPTEESEVFTTAADNQTSVQIRVFQGEREITQENEFLGSFTLTDLPETQAETTRIEVTFAIDANGILRVEAAEMETDRNESIVIKDPPDESVSNLEPPDIVLQEDTPLSIGVEVDNGLFERIVPKDSFIPAEESRLFTTAADDQTDVQLRVFYGEREIAAENELLGEFTLTDIPPTPAGTPEIEVECSVAEDGTIDVAAEEQTSDNQASIITEEDANLSDSEIEKLLKDAEEHAEKDQERRQEIMDGNVDADLNEAKSLPARCPSGTDQLTKTDKLIEALASDRPPEFKGESVLVEALADGAVDFESEEEFLEALVEMAIRIDDQETLLNELARETTGFREPEDIRTTLRAIVEESAEVENGRDLVETVVEHAMDVRNDLHRGYHYCRRNSQSASAIEDGLQGTGDKIQKILDQSPGIIWETKASDATVRQLYRTLEAIQDRLQQEKMSMAELESSIKWLDESFVAVGCTMINPEIGTEPDPYQHQVWTTTKSDLPEGEIARIEEVGYERDGKIKQDAKVVISEGRPSVPQIDTGAEKIPSLQVVRSPPRRILSVEDFQTIENLGHDGQAIIKKVRLPDNKAPPEVVALREPAASETMTSETGEEFLKRAETWVTIDARERDKRRWEESEYIVGVIDTGDDCPWIAMEYMQGGDLTELLEDYPDGLPVGQALWIGECICKGLEIAHQSGRVHLDVKPGNVLLKQTDGWPWPKLADWGLARTLARETGTMQELSVEHASPEQFDSSTFGDPDQLTDIYQTGTVIYALLTGAPPVTGSQFEVMQQVMSEEAIPAPSERRAELPAAVDAVIGLALEQDKTERYDSITEFRKAVQAIRTDERLPKAVATRLWK